jgi:hypothetical protein
MKIPYYECFLGVKKGLFWVGREANLEKRRFIICEENIISRFLFPSPKDP